MYLKLRSEDDKYRYRYPSIYSKEYLRVRGRTPLVDVFPVEGIKYLRVRGRAPLVNVLAVEGIEYLRVRGRAPLV